MNLGAGDCSRCDLPWLDLRLWCPLGSEAVGDVIRRVAVGMARMEIVTAWAICRGPWFCSTQSRPERPVEHHVWLQKRVKGDNANIDKRPQHAQTPDLPT